MLASLLLLSNLLFLMFLQLFQKLILLRKPSVAQVFAVVGILP
jgi:hypothetical protein